MVTMNNNNDTDDNDNDDGYGDDIIIIITDFVEIQIKRIKISLSYPWCVLKMQ